MKGIEWSIPGTNEPYKLSFLEIMGRKSPTTLSEVVISYHYIPEAIAQKIIAGIRSDDDRVKAEIHAVIFNSLRMISPAEISWYARLCSKFPRLLSRRSPIRMILRKFAPVITWADYAQRLGWDVNNFINTYNGLTIKVEKYFRMATETA